MLRKIASFVGCGCATVLAVLFVVIVFVIDRSGTDADRERLDERFVERIEPATDPQLEAVNQVLDDDFQVDDAFALRSSFHENAYWLGSSVRETEEDTGRAGVWLLFGDALFVDQVWAANQPAVEMSGAPSWRGSDRWAGFHQNEIAPLERYVRQRAGDE